MEIMAAAPSVFEEKPRDVASGRTWPYPATYFVHMPRDTRTAEYVAKDILAIRKQVSASLLSTCFGQFMKRGISSRYTYRVFITFARVLNSCLCRVKALRYCIRGGGREFEFQSSWSGRVL